jgi:hypothetical protein
MNYYKYLKNIFPLYIISGILLGVAVLSLFAAHRYNNTLRDTRNNLENINLKVNEMRDETDRIDSLIQYFQDNFGIREEKARPERLILHTLDDIKRHFHNESMIVSGFEDIAGEKQLPVEIRIPVNSYKSVIDCIQYLESFRLPKYRIKNLSIMEEQLGGVILDIQGGLVTPAEGQQLIAVQ